MNKQFQRSNYERGRGILMCKVVGVMIREDEKFTYQRKETGCVLI